MRASAIGAPRHMFTIMQSGEQSVFLTAEWRDLAMLNYAVDPHLLRGLVPHGTQLDDFQGKCFLSLVGFRFLRTKVAGLSIPFHRNFDEVNLRFYVRRRDGTNWRRGVVFVREIVPRRAIALIARIFYNEKYIALPMSHAIERTPARLRVRYQWTSRQTTNHISLTASGEPTLPEERSEAQFITEHFWGYSSQPGGGCMEYRVEHPSWKVWTAQSARFEGDAVPLYGAALGAVLQHPPDSAFLAEGSAVSVSKGRKIQPTTP